MKKDKHLHIRITEKLENDIATTAKKEKIGVTEFVTETLEKRILKGEGIKDLPLDVDNHHGFSRTKMKDIREKMKRV